MTEGTQVPAFTLKDQNGRTVSLSKFKGKPVVVYFYPADETPGCTKQVTPLCVCVCVRLWCLVQSLLTQEFMFCLNQVCNLGLKEMLPVRLILLYISTL